MKLPEFTAEASLYKTKELYRPNGILFGGEGAVKPARGGFPCSMCDDICAGGTSICDRWCACACRGGRHCGHPD
jgi:hypothetical protein